MNCSLCYDYLNAFSVYVCTTFTGQLTYDSLSFDPITFTNDDLHVRKKAFCLQQLSHCDDQNSNVIPFCSLTTSYKLHVELSQQSESAAACGLTAAYYLAWSIVRRSTRSNRSRNHWLSPVQGCHCLATKRSQLTTVNKRRVTVISSEMNFLLQLL